MGVLQDLQRTNFFGSIGLISKRVERFRGFYHERLSETAWKAFGASDALYPKALFGR